MKISIIRKINIAILLFMVVGLQAQMRYTVQDVPNVQLQDYTRYVSDPEHVLANEEVAELDKKLAELRNSMNLQTAVVVIPAIDTDKYSSAREFAMVLFNDWGIGDRGIDNGLLILLLTAKGNREVVFETGYGVEDILTDGLCKLIQTRRMVPLMKNGEYGKGLIAGVEEVRKVLDGTTELSERDPIMSNFTMWLLIWFFGGFIIILLVDFFRKSTLAGKENNFELAAKYNPLLGIGCLLLILFFPSYFIYLVILEMVNRNHSLPKINCKQCGGKRTIKQARKSQVIKRALPGQDGRRRYYFVCQSCNYRHEIDLPFKYQKPQSSSYSGSSGGSSSYGSSGGSSSGGSWGGGSSGGGGASTKF